MCIRDSNLDEVEQATVKYALKYVISPDMEEERRENSFQDICLEYGDYIEKYFNNFLSGSGLKLRKQQVITKNLYTLMSFSTNQENMEDLDNINILKNVIDILGLSSIGNIDSELIVKKRLSGFTRDGFFVIKDKAPVNWTVMSAIKDADYFAKIIIGGEENDE